MLLIYVHNLNISIFFFYRELGLLRQRRNAGNDRFSKKRPRSNCKRYPLSQPMFCKHVSSTVECFLLHMYTRIKLTSLVNDLIYKHKHELGGGDCYVYIFALPHYEFSLGFVGQQFSYLIILDYESTCWEQKKFQTQEISKRLLQCF